MLKHIGLATLAAVFLVIFLPSFALADDVNFGIVPSEVRIGDIHPGQSTEFDLTIHNNDAVPRIFTLATYPPPVGQEREGKNQFPDGSWIEFSLNQISVAPYDEATVTVTLDIPREQEWTSQEWETWAGVTAESSDFMAARLYVRVLVSTNSTIASRFNVGFFAAVGSAALVACGGIYYFRRRARFE